MRVTGWTQVQLAEHLGANQNDVSRWLKGRVPRGHTMEAIRELALRHGVLTDSPKSLSENERRLQSFFARLAGAPPIVQDRVIDFGEWQLQLWEDQKKAGKIDT